MLKRLVHNGKFGLDYPVVSRSLCTAAVGCLGIGLLIVESAVLSGQGIQGGAVSLIAVLAASTVSSIAGFAFSALCGALLFHVMESPVYAVEVIDRLQYCDPGAQRGCALALNRL